MKELNVENIRKYLKMKSKHSWDMHKLYTSENDKYRSEYYLDKAFEIDAILLALEDEKSFNDFYSILEG